jgi:hypothetical protein
MVITPLGNQKAICELFLQKQTNSFPLKFVIGVSGDSGCQGIQGIHGFRGFMVSGAERKRWFQGTKKQSSRLRLMHSNLYCIHPMLEAADYWQSEPQRTLARPSESYVNPDGPPSGWIFGGHRSHEPKTSESGNRESTGVAQIGLGGA